VFPPLEKGIYRNKNKLHILSKHGWHNHF